MDFSGFECCWKHLGWYKSKTQKYIIKVSLFLDEEEEHLSVEAWPVRAIISPFRSIKSALLDSIIYADWSFTHVELFPQSFICFLCEGFFSWIQYLTFTILCVCFSIVTGRVRMGQFIRLCTRKVHRLCVDLHFFFADPALNPAVLCMKSNMHQISHSDVSVVLLHARLYFFFVSSARPDRKTTALFPNSN